MGGKIVVGGSPGNNGPAFYEPTVITDIPAGSPMVTEEVFGPVAPIFRFATTEEAVSIANSTRFGLGASVWTGDRKLASMVAERLDTGTVAINGFVRSDPALPFGGVKDSGYGRELSFEGFCEFLNVKSVAFY
jgi:succinate-semialdehyde dehydrogenase/glutarate-semialdehyde dehydrogenase